MVTGVSFESEVPGKRALACLSAGNTKLEKYGAICEETEALKKWSVKPKETKQEKTRLRNGSR